MKFEDMEIWKRSARLSAEFYKSWINETREISAMLVSFINSIKNQLKTDG